MAKTIVKGATYTEIEQIKKNLMNIWISNIPFSKVMLCFIDAWKKLNVPISVIYEIINISTHVDHLLAGQTYHTVAYFDLYLNEIIFLFEQLR